MRPKEKISIFGGRLRPESNHDSVRWDHGTHEEFYRYYEKASETPNAIQRFRAIRDTVIRLNEWLIHTKCEVADIGCGAGSQSILWAEVGCNVHAVDVNERLLQLAQQRARKAGYPIDFVLGSATA